jgi:outer membrane protein TolC
MSEHRADGGAGRQVIPTMTLVLLLIVPAPASAQAPVRLTPDEAIARGLEASPRLEELRARHDAAQASVEAREAASRPLVAAHAGFMRTNHVEEFGVPQPDGSLRLIYPDIPDNYRTRLDVQWPLYTGGRTEALTSAARSERDAAGRDLETAREELRLEIARAYWGLVTASASARVVGEAVGRVEAHLQDLRNQLASGLIPPNDVFAAEAQRARQRVLAIEATNAREVAAAELRRLVGLPAETPIEPAMALEAAPPVAPPIEALIARALESRPERRALLDRITAAAARGAAAGASARPQIGIAAGADYARPNPRIFPRSGDWRSSWDASINATWSLWDGGRAAAEQAEAGALERAARERLEDFDRRLEVELRQRRLDLESSRAAVEAAAEGVRAAAEARRVVGERFAAGVATSTDVLDAQVALLEAELDRTRALANLHLAQARLERATGG